MPTLQQWLEVFEYIRQRWLVQGMTGDEVAEDLAGIGFYVKGSQVDYRARRWGWRKRLPVDTAALENPTDQGSHSTTSEQRDADDRAASHQSNMDLNTLSDQAQVENAWAAGENETSGSGHAYFAAFSGPSSATTQPWDYHTADVISHSPRTSQHDQGSLDDVGSHWMMTQEGPSSPQPQSLEDHYDLGASVHEDTEGSFEPSVNQVGYFYFSHEINGFTELGIDPQSLPLWNPINSYGESDFAYDTDAESWQENTQ